MTTMSLMGLGLLRTSARGSKSQATVSPRRRPERGVQRLLDRVAAAAHVAPFTAHDFRRTVARDLLDVKGEVATLQQIAGHSDPATTSRYDRRGAEARRKAASAQCAVLRWAAEQ